MVMTHSDDDKILKELYQQGNKDEPSAALDQLILQQAKQSHLGPQNKPKWRPWLAAASVILVMPMIWLLVQNEQLLDQSAPSPQLEMHKPQAAKPAKELRQRQDRAAAPEPVIAESIAEEEEEEEEEPVDTPSESFEADAYSVDAVFDNDAFQESMQDDIQDSEVVVTGSRSQSSEPESASVESNREMLMNEFKAKKKTLKQSNLDPLLALELQQFEQYLEDGEVAQATQLLQEMMQREPDFDYQQLEQRLADAQAN
jgi:hypothetical protein